MSSLTFFRWTLFALGAFAFATATVLRELLQRWFLRSFVVTAGRLGGGPTAPLRLLTAAVQRTWLFCVYHLSFAIILFAGWWYFGTPGGAETWARMLTQH